MPEPIILFGATGYTGRLTARALCHRGLPFAIAGRDKAKLQALAQSLPWRPTTIAVSVTDDGGLREAFRGRKLVLNGVGPFMQWGESVVRAAIDEGLHYADTTGELPFMRLVHQRYDAHAKAAGLSIVPAAAFEVALADCLSAKLTRQAGSVEEVEILYRLRGMRPSKGTFLSIINVAKDGGCGYRNGKWKNERPGRTMRRIPLPLTGGKVSAVSFPSGEIATVPLHVNATHVRTFFALPAPVAGGAVLGGALLPPLARLGGGFVERRLQKGAEGPSEQKRAAAEFLVSVRVKTAGKWRQTAVSGHDVYGVTAWIQAYTAEALLRRNDVARGVVAPSMVLDVEDFLAALRGQAVTEYQPAV